MIFIVIFYIQTAFYILKGYQRPVHIQHHLSAATSWVKGRSQTDRHNRACCTTAKEKEGMEFWSSKLGQKNFSKNVMALLIYTHKRQ